MPKPQADLLHLALATWRAWGCESSNSPTVLKKIAGGLTNQSYLLACGKHYLVLRLHNPHSAALGIDRTNERIILHALAPTGLVPALRYWSPDQRFSVFDYIAGRVWTPADLVNAKQKAKLQSAIKQYQEIKPTIAHFNYHLHISRYWQQLTPQKKLCVTEQLGSWPSFSKRLLCFQSQHWPRVLTHHDLNPANIMESEGRIYILDWEYAGLGHSALDYVSVNLPLIKAQQNKILPVHEIRLWLEQLWLALSTR